MNHYGMSRLLLTQLLLTGALQGADAPLPQGVTRWTVDTKESVVRFHGVSTLHDFDGTAALTSGRLDLTPGHETGMVMVSASSMTTGNDSRDRTMHATYMESGIYPDITFVLQSLTHAGSTVTAHGTWSMHGVSSVVDLPVILPPAPAPPGAKARLDATFPIDMRTWNIAVPRTLGFVKVRPVITVEVHLVLMPATDPAPAKH